MKTAAIDHLIDQGWREYPDQFRTHARCFYKRHETPTRCACKDGKPGLQVGVFVSHLLDRESYEMEVAGELSDGTWLKIYQWSMPDDIRDGLSRIPRMLSSWEHAANFKL